MRYSIAVFLSTMVLASPFVSSAEDTKTVAVIGTGDMGNSLGPKLASIGYRVVYGSRDPSAERVQKLLKITAPTARAATQK